MTLHFWGVRSEHIPGALLRMATGRRQLRHTRGATFWKLLGTGSGETFALRDADFHHWGLLIAWDNLANARIFEHSKLVESWEEHCFESARFQLNPLSTRGSWSKQQPFEPVSNQIPTGQIAAITRARIKPSQWSRFAQFVPPVAEAVNNAPGLVMRTGIGEAPIGLQGTFSIWESQGALEQFAYDAPHRQVIEETQRSGWYSEELFARFSIEASEGFFAGQAMSLSA